MACLSVINDYTSPASGSNPRSVLGAIYGEPIRVTYDPQRCAVTVDLGRAKLEVPLHMLRSGGMLNAVPCGEVASDMDYCTPDVSHYHYNGAGGAVSKPETRKDMCSRFLYEK